MKRFFALQVNFLVTCLAYLGLAVLVGIPIGIFIRFVHPPVLAYALGYAYDFAILLALVKSGNPYLPFTVAQKTKFASLTVGLYVLMNIAYSIFYRQISDFIDFEPHFRDLFLLCPLFVLLFLNWRLLFRWGLTEERQPA